MERCGRGDGAVAVGQGRATWRGDTVNVPIVARSVVMAAVCLLGCGGCGGSQEMTPSVADGTSDKPVKIRPPQSSSPSRPSAAKKRAATPSAAATPIQTPGADAPVSPVDKSPATPGGAPPRRTLGELVPTEVVDDGPPPPQPIPVVDESRLAGLGIRTLRGKHLVLYTDLPESPEIAELPQVFDLAVPQWCRYFEVDPARAAPWQVAAYLIGERAKFERAGLVPGDLPEFLHGFHRGVEAWMYEQPSAYYRRHLLLHEGTHAFMGWSLGGAGPPWYMEGTAELLATHRWEGGQLRLAIFPSSKEAVPEWGRIKIVRDDFRAGVAKSLVEVMSYDSRAHLRVEPYAWCWAVCAFLDGNPRYRERFRKLKGYARDTEAGFSERFLGWFREDGQQVWREWQWFIVNADYGYDLERESWVVPTEPMTGLPAAGGEVSVVADRGWQSSGWTLTAGHRYSVVAEGRFELAQVPQPWLSEANGVTVRYFRGQPLGRLLAAVVDETDPRATDNGFLKPIPLGNTGELVPEVSGTLYLRLNDSPSELNDNRGSVRVRISP